MCILSHIPLFLISRQSSTRNRSAIYRYRIPLPPYSPPVLPGFIALSAAIRFTVAQRRDRHRIALRRVTRAFRRTAGRNIVVKHRPQPGGEVIRGLHAIIKRSGRPDVSIRGGEWRRVGGVEIIRYRLGKVTWVGDEIGTGAGSASGNWN